MFAVVVAKKAGRKTQGALRLTDVDSIREKKRIIKTRNIYSYNANTEEHAVVQFAEALRYKSEGRGFDSRWYHWNFSLTLRRLMSYIYGAPILDVSRSHTTTQHSR